MLNLVLWTIVFIASLAILIKAADYFVDSAEKIGIYIKIPMAVVGVTIVAIGTSLPEMMSSIMSVSEGYSELVAGIVIGSNIVNISFFLGTIIVLAGKLKLTNEMNEIPFLFISTFFLTITILDGIFCILDGILCIFVFLVYLIYLRKFIRKFKQKNIHDPINSKKSNMSKKTVMILFISAFFVYFGAKYTIISMIELSEIIGIGKEVLAITVVAAGTSLPEFMVSLSGLKKGNFDIAIGNLIGSNIFNALGIMGVSALFGKLIIPEKIIYHDLPLMIIVTILYTFIAYDKEITRNEGVILILFYIMFIGLLTI